ncbi:acyl-homoserine-lactone synthase TraI [Agrobacterium tumefaciens]|uniref:acyl-homoserine-lactone synthase n=1 Tax=Agrobacterium tumefaciens TaxID=358 RepID=UPI00287DE02B|nr:acyl-homoserine-lactone synthase TraI [Agrobacterium tumefaciens]MDS7598429.1 acyl-homoserine-lactone synthase TraI [Agrobacterium tumefaciens]
MDIRAISKPQSDIDKKLLIEQHKLRAHIFAGRLGWEVEVRGGAERDRFDDLGPTYILAVLGEEKVIGCARLLPATGATMVADVFPSLLPDGKLHYHPAMIESSRFCVDTRIEEGRGSNVIHETTLAMFSGIIEWSVVNGYSEIVTVTDLRFERILSRIGWPLQRIGHPSRIGVTTAVAGTLPTDPGVFARLRPSSYRSSIARCHR